MQNVSYCCIFKNEEKHFPKWIECAKAVACDEGDEIFAVDTGSTDNSLKILEEAGIQTYYFEWINDFSAAKNFALEKAKNPWIVFLDCDEYFDEKSIPRVKEFIEKANEDKMVLVIESDIININPDNNDQVISKFIHWRVFRNQPDFRYTNKIHEALHYFGEGIFQVYKSDLTILHTGYSSSLSKSKGLRNKELLEAEIAANKDGDITTQQAYYMANTYSQIGDVKKAAEYARIAIKGPDSELGFMTVRMYRDLVQEEEETGGADYDKIMNIITRGLLRVPNHPDFLVDKMRTIFRRQYFYEIEKLCYQIIGRADAPDIAGKYESNALTMLFFVYHMMSNVQFHKGDVVESRRFAVMALEQRNYDRELLGNFVKCFRYETLDIIKPIIDALFKEPTKEDKDAFKYFFAAMPFNEVYLHYVKPKSHTFEYYMCKKLYSKALKLCEKELIDLYKLAAAFYAQYPKECAALKIAVPPKYLKGAKKTPKNDMQFQELIDKLMFLFSKIILACLSMTEEEFNGQKNIMGLLEGPCKNCILAAYECDCAAISDDDITKFYNYIAPVAEKECISKLSKVIEIMPLKDETRFPIIQDLLVKKELQGAYNILDKVEDRGQAYNMLAGIAQFYAKDFIKAREFFLKARAVGGDNREVLDFIKWTDPADAIVVNV